METNKEKLLLLKIIKYVESKDTPFVPFGDDVVRRSQLFPNQRVRDFSVLYDGIVFNVSVFNTDSSLNKKLMVVNITMGTERVMGRELKYTMFLDRGDSDNRDLITRITNVCDKFSEYETEIMEHELDMMFYVLLRKEWT